MNVNLDFKDLKEGQEIELILKDQLIVDSEGKIQESDTLENQYFTQTYNNQYQENIRKLIKYDPTRKYEDENHTILPQYDQIQRDKQGIRIVDGQVFVDTSLKIQNNLSEKNQGISLDYQDKIATDYVQGNNAKSIKFQKRAQKNSSLINMLEMNLDEEENNQKKEEIKSTNQPKEINKNNYLRAVEKAQKQQMEATQRNNVIFKDNEEELQLQKSIQKNQMQKFNILDELQQQTNYQSDQIEGVETKHQFEFLSSLSSYKQQLKPHSYQNKFTLQDAKQGTTSILNVKLPTEKLAINKQQTEEESNSFPEEINENEQNLFHQKPIGSGLANTLQLLRESGLLQKQQQYKGRANDELPETKNNEIKIEYRDRSGNLLTPKEAFRQIGQQFHGRKSGKNKLEKRKRKEILLEKQKQLQPEEMPLFKTLKAHQEKSKEAFVVLSTKQQ